MTSDIKNRCVNDINTKLRKKYDLYYHIFEKQIGSRVWMGGKEYILLSSNDYLGLGTHPKVQENVKNFLKTWGGGTTGSRIANGGRLYHEKLEEKLAYFLGQEACHISVCGYISCMSTAQTFASKKDIIFADSNIHSSLWSGITLSGAKTERFKHNDPIDFAKSIKNYTDNNSKLLIVEGVYSMEGHIAPLDKFISISKAAKVFTIIDDAHGFGVLGEQGRGTTNHFKCEKSVDIVCGSFSKALSSTGGFVAGDKSLIEYLRTYSKQTIFSAAISPVQAAVADSALDIMMSEPEHLERLWQSTYKYKKMLISLGINYWNSQTPCVPLLIDTREQAYFFWKFLKDHGIYTILTLPPAVPAGKNLIRTAISARHTSEDLDKIFEVFKKAVKAVF